MKISRHALTVLTRQYRSVLLKCALINAGLFLAVAPAMADDLVIGYNASGQITSVGGTTIPGAGTFSIPDAYTKTQVDATLANYTTTTGLNAGTAVINAASLKVDGNNVLTTGDLPTNVSDLTNDAGYITSADLPTKTSELTNDSGFITSADLPTKTSELTNDSGFITSADLPTKTSELTNDSGFITDTVAKSGTGDQTAFSATATNTTAGVTHIFTVGSTGVKVDGGEVLTENSDLNGAKITDGTVALSALASTDLSGFNNDAGFITDDITKTGTGSQTVFSASATNTSDSTTHAFVVSSDGVKVDGYDVLTTADLGFTKGTGTGEYATIADYVNTAPATLTNKTIDATANTISNLGVGNFASANIADGTTSSTLLTTQSYVDEAIVNALDAKTDLVDEATVGTTDYKAMVKADATSQTITLNVTDETAGNLLAGITIDGDNGIVDVTGDANVSGALTADSVKVGGASGATLSLVSGALSSDTKVVSANGFEVDTNNALTSSGLTASAATIAGNANVGTMTVGAAGNETFMLGSDGSIVIGTKLSDSTNKVETFSVDASGNVTTAGTVSAAGGKFQVNSDGKIVDVRGIDIADGTDGSQKVSLSVDHSDGSFSIGNSTLAKAFTVEADGDTTVAGTLTIGGANAITGSANALDMGANALNDTAGLTVGAAGNETFMLGSDGSIVIGTKLSDSTNKVETFSVDASGKVTAAGGADITGTTTLLNSSDPTKKVALSANSDGDLVVDHGINVAGGNFTVDTNGDTTVAGTLTIGGAGAITGTAGTSGNPNTLSMGNNVLDNINSLKVGSSDQFQVSNDGAVTTTSTITADGESKLGKIGSTTTYALDVVSGADAANSTVTANAVIEATQGVRFGAAAGTNPVMTSVNHGTAIAAMDKADTTTTTGNDVVASAQAVAKTRDAINAELNAQLGDIFTVNSDRSLTYKDAALAGNGFETGATTLADELTKYAENVVNATGVSFAADGTPTTAYVVKTATDTADYSNVTAGTSLKAAIDKLDKNIGLAMTPTGATRTTATFRTAATNTVNQNLSALDAAIGADVTGVDRSASLAGASTAAANSVNANIDALDVALGNLTYTGGSVNYTNGTGSVTTAIQTINANIGAATTAAKGNIASGNSVNANLDSLDAAIGDRSFATTKYVAPNDDLATAVTKLDTKLYNLDHEVKELHHEMDRGLASVAALSALIPNARGTGNTTLSAGTGYYNGHSSFALGGAHWFTDNLMVNIGAAASLGHTRDMTYRAGISYSF